MTQSVHFKLPWPHSDLNANSRVHWRVRSKRTKVARTTAWALTADYDSFWRTSDNDGVYGPNGSLLRSGQGSDARFVATALSINSEWSLNRNVSVTAIYTHFSPREFLEHTGPARAIEFIELTARFRF